MLHTDAYGLDSGCKYVFDSLYICMVLLLLLLLLFWQTFYFLPVGRSGFICYYWRFLQLLMLVMHVNQVRDAKIKVLGSLKQETDEECSDWKKLAASLKASAFLYHLVRKGVHNTIFKYGLCYLWMSWNALFYVSIIYWMLRFSKFLHWNQLGQCMCQFMSSSYQNLQ